jgi:hypothetical protein
VYVREDGDKFLWTPQCRLYELVEGRNGFTHRAGAFDKEFAANYDDDSEIRQSIDFIVMDWGVVSAQL